MVSLRDSRTVNQGYLSSNSVESSTARICRRMLARCLALVRLSSAFPRSPRNSQLEGQKGELISISRRGRVYSQTSLPPAAGDGDHLNPCSRRCLRSFPPLILFLFRFLSPLPLLPALLDSSSNRTRSGDYFSFARFYLL